MLWSPRWGQPSLRWILEECHLDPSSNIKDFFPVPGGCYYTQLAAEGLGRKTPVAHSYVSFLSGWIQRLISKEYKAMVPHPQFETIFERSSQLWAPGVMATAFTDTNSQLHFSLLHLAPFFSFLLILPILSFLFPPFSFFSFFQSTT